VSVNYTNKTLIILHPLPTNSTLITDYQQLITF